MHSMNAWLTGREWAHLGNLVSWCVCLRGLPCLGLFWLTVLYFLSIGIRCLFLHISLSTMFCLSRAGARNYRIKISGTRSQNESSSHDFVHMCCHSSHKSPSHNLHSRDFKVFRHSGKYFKHFLLKINVNLCYIIILSRGNLNELLKYIPSKVIYMSILLFLQ